MEASWVTVVYSIACFLAVVIFIGALLTDSFVRGISSPERKEVSYNFRPVLILAVRILSKDLKHSDGKARDMLTTKQEPASHLVRVGRQLKKPSRSVGTVSVATYAEGLT